MKTFARSAMLTEYLRYIWSRPVAARIAVENTALPRPVPVPVAFRKLPGQQSVLASALAQRTISKAPDRFGRFATRGIVGLVLLAVWLIFGEPSGQAQTQLCPETNVLKFIQAPNLDGGYDLWDSGPWALADDFICTNTGPIVDIHLWAGWLNDIVDPNATFWLGIYDDIPATNGPVYIPSRPGTNLLWQQYFGPGQYSQSLFMSPAPGQFIDPGGPAPMGGDSKVYYYCFYPTNPPVQTGTLTNPKIYWLAVYAQPSQGSAMLFGWRSAKLQQFDISTHTPWPGGAPITTDWRPSYNLNNQGLDLAFKINTLTNREPPPPCCPETNGVKFVQRPQIPFGLDVNASQNPAGQKLVLADDFQCTNTGPVTDIHLWGSWLSDNVDPAALFTLTIWSDVPKQTNGTVTTPSHPGVVLWTEPFGPGEYYQCLYSNITEQFYDPSLPAIIGGDSKVYYLCFYPKNPFVQQGTTARPTNYWLSVSAQTTAGAQMLFGWHTSSDSYNDIAVWGNAPFPAAWNTLIDPQGVPISLAFKVTTPTNQPCPPGTIFCPANKTVECGSTWNFDDPRATNDCCGSNVTLIIIGTVTNTAGCTNNITRTWQVSDCSGFTANCSQTVTVVDTTPPQFIYCPTNRTVECGTQWSFDTPIATDSCCLQGVGILGTFTNGTCPQVITRVWVARDCCGNTNLCTQNVTNVDTTPPVITCAPGKVVQCGTAWTFDPPTATDNCCLAGISVLSTVTNGTCPQIITRFWVAKDCCGNTNTCSQTVTNLDTTPPVLTCSPDKTVQCGTPWTFDPPTATDNCCSNPTVSLVSTVTNGSGCSYVVSRTWVAIDCCQNRSIPCTQRVTVVDTLPPTIICPTNRTIYTCQTNAVVTWTVSATDNCSPNITVTSSPPSGTAFTRGTTNTVLVTADDGCGNTNTCSFTITVLQPTLTIVYNPTLHTITLTWQDGILQEADYVLGPYADLPLATSPYTVSATGPYKFYRLRCP